MPPVTENNQRRVVITTHEKQTALIAGQGSFLERISMSGLSDIELDTSLPAEYPTAFDVRAKVGNPKAG